MYFLYSRYSKNIDEIRKLDENKSYSAPLVILSPLPTVVVNIIDVPTMIKEVNFLHIET